MYRVGLALSSTKRTIPHKLWRVTIAEFHERGQRVWQKLGFGRVQTFAHRGDGLTFGVRVQAGAADEPPSGAIRSRKC